MDVLIRTARIPDLDAIEKIERASLRSPWSRQMLLDELGSEKGLNLVAEIGGKIAGYLFTMLVPPEMHLLDIAVAPDFRRSGVGRLLMEQMFKKAKEKGCTVCTLEVRSGNTSAIAFYGKFNFILKGRRRAYYQDTGEDALIFWTE